MCLEHLCGAVDGPYRLGVQRRRPVGFHDRWDLDLKYRSNPQWWSLGRLGQACQEEHLAEEHVVVGAEQLNSDRVDSRVRQERPVLGSRLGADRNRERHGGPAAELIQRQRHGAVEAGAEVPTRDALLNPVAKTFGG